MCHAPEKRKKRFLNVSNTFEMEKKNQMYISMRQDLFTT